VLASMALADHPQVLLPIIFYNLVQHLVAGTVDYLMCRRSDEQEVELDDVSAAHASDTTSGVFPLRTQFWNSK
jgi:hypothetical protein